MIIASSAKKARPQHNNGNLTYLVGCRLQMTSFPLLRFVSRGKVPLGTICSVVPKHIERSALLQIECCIKAISLLFQTLNSAQLYLNPLLASNLSNQALYLSIYPFIKNKIINYCQQQYYVAIQLPTVASRASTCTPISSSL